MAEYKRGMYVCTIIQNERCSGRSKAASKIGGKTYYMILKHRRPQLFEIVNLGSFVKTSRNANFSKVPRAPQTVIVANISITLIFNKIIGIEFKYLFFNRCITLDEIRFAKRGIIKNYLGSLVSQDW